MRLYIIRHGETTWNREKRFQGQTDIPLAENGITLAEKIGAAMQDISFDYIISSPLRRAVQTALLVTKGRKIPFSTDHRIQEISFGDWEGKTVASEDPKLHEYLNYFFTTPLQCKRPPRGETFQDVCVRTKDFLADLIGNPKYADANLLISTHGAAGRCLLHALNEESEDIWRGCIPPNCSVSIVDVIDGQASLVEQDKLYA